MKDARALKLLEAFSGVEDDLLERCERAVVSTSEKKSKIVWRKALWQYGSAVAAVLCIAIVTWANRDEIRLTKNEATYEMVKDTADYEETKKESMVYSMVGSADGMMAETDAEVDQNVVAATQINAERFDAYIPTNLPEGYVQKSICENTDEDSLTIEWCRADEIITIKIMLSEAKQSEEDMNSEGWDFAVLYPDGVKVYFKGRGTAEEIMTIFDGMELIR